MTREVYNSANECVKSIQEFQAQLNTLSGFSNMRLKLTCEKCKTSTLPIAPDIGEDLLGFLNTEYTAKLNEAEAALAQL